MLMCMCMLNRRVQILLDKEMWNKIVKNAKAQKISAGEYIRRAVSEYKDVQKEIEIQQKPQMPFNRFFKARRK